MSVYEQLSTLMERYEIVASQPHYAMFWNGSRTFKLYRLLESGRCIELAVNSTMEQYDLRKAIAYGNELLIEHLTEAEVV